MKRISVLSLVLFGMLMLSIGQAKAVQITTDYDHQANFSQYKTYSWLKVQAGDSLWEDRIKRNVDSQLAAKGWTEVASGGSASVTAFQSTSNQQTLNTFYDGFGGGGWGYRGFGRGGFGGGFGGSGMSTTTTDITKIGTLVIDVFDSKNQQLLWRGKQSDALSSNPNKNEQNLAKDLQKMFKNFPPKK
jgi:hypothetical protein